MFAYGASEQLFFHHTKSLIYPYQPQDYIIKCGCTPTATSWQAIGRFNFNVLGRLFPMLSLGANNSILNVENSNADWYVLILPYSPLVFDVSFVKAYFAFESEGLYSKESHCYAANANRESNF